MYAQASSKHAVADCIITASLLPVLVNFLNETEHLAIVGYAAICLAETASLQGSGHTKKVVQAGAVPLLVKHVHADNLEIASDCVFALGNIAGEDVSCRNAVLEANILDAFLVLTEMLEELTEPAIELIRQASWTTFNLVRLEPAPSEKYVIKAVEFIKYILDLSDQESACTGLYALKCVMKSHPDLEFEPVLASAVKWAPQSYFAFGMLKEIINRKDDVKTQQLIDAGFLDALRSMLQMQMELIDGNDKSFAEGMMVLSNIMAGTDSHRDALIKSRSLPVLFRAASLSVKSSFRFGKNEYYSFYLSQRKLSLLVIGYFRREWDAMNFNAKISPKDVASVACLYFEDKNFYGKQIVRESVNGIVNGLKYGNQKEIETLLQKDVVWLLFQLLNVEQDCRVLENTMSGIEHLVTRTNCIIDFDQSNIAKLGNIVKSCSVSDDMVLKAKKLMNTIEEMQNQLRKELIHQSKDGTGHKL